MKQFIIVIVLGAALFMGAAWQFGLLPGVDVAEKGTLTSEGKAEVVPPDKLGGVLYEKSPFVEIAKAPARRIDPIVLHGAMNPVEQEEVSSQVNGRILFLGDQVEDNAVLAAGSAAFLAEPYYFSEIYGGRESFVKFYRRIYEGETIRQGQMLAMIEPAEALGGVLEEIGKIKAAHAEYAGAIAAEEEGGIRERRAFKLWKMGNLADEEYGSAKLTYIKLQADRKLKAEGIKLAEIKKDSAEIKLRAFEIRPTLQYRQSTIKTIIRQRGFVVKAGDPVLIVQNLERMMAEALVEEQYLGFLKKMGPVSATIEPTVLEKPMHEYPGHALDVTSVGVARDNKIVSGSEDRSVCVWDQEQIAPLAKLEHDDAVRVVVCTPTKAAKNLFLAGCSNGNIYLWELPADGKKQDYTPKLLKMIDKDKAHGADVSITSLAFSLDGTFFASGASDGSIRLWTTSVKKKDADDIDYAVERYAFIPANGVAQSHDDAVTSLNFTPQCQLISAGRDKTLRVWSLKEKGAHLDGKMIRDRVGNVPQLGVTHDGKWMLFDQGRTLKLFSVEKRTFTNTLSTPPNSTPFDTLALFSPDSSLMLTAGAPEGRLQLWRTPDAAQRGFEVRQFATRDRLPVACAAFAQDGSFAVSASGSKIYQWPIPSKKDVDNHQMKNVRMTVINQNLDASKNGRIGFEIPNSDGRFEAGRPVTIVIE